MSKSVQIHFFFARLFLLVHSVYSQSQPFVGYIIPLLTGMNPDPTICRSTTAKNVLALSGDQLRVELADGRVHQITIAGSGGDGQTPTLAVKGVKTGRKNDRKK